MLHSASSPSGEKKITAQLERIVSHKLFSKSIILCNFLRYIVTETLSNKQDQLKEYTIAIEALGKTPEFNPQTDAVVRIHAVRLRKLLTEYYCGPGSSDPVVIEVIKGSYVPKFRLHAASRAQISESNGSENYSRSKLTLAVLPFRNLCEENSYQFFTEGLGEELTSLFSTHQDISVIAYHSTRKYSDPQYDIHTIAAELGVHYLITGSVQRTTKEIRISVGLAETVNSTQVWSKRYCHSFQEEDLVQVQDRIVNDIFSILSGYYGFIVRDAVSSGRSKKTVSIEAFDAVLWNYYFHMHFTEEAYLETRKALELALEKDPNQACCLAILSELYIDAHTFGFPSIENPIEVAYEMAKKSIAIDPTCQHAHRSFGWANVYLRNKKGAMEAMEICLELNPLCVSTIGTTGFGMACVGEYDRSFKLLNDSLALNPNCPWWYYLGYFMIYYNAGEYNKALAAANKITQPEVFFNPVTKAAAKGKLGLIEAAYQDNLKLIKDFQPLLGELKDHLGAFILDDQLVDEILDGLSRSGFQSTRYKTKMWI